MCNDKIMNKNFNRDPTNLNRIYFKKGNGLISKNINTFLKKYHVHKIIRILNKDFKLIKKNKKKLIHFSIANTPHRSKKKYLIVKILKSGYYNGKIYHPPILDANNFILARCISSKNNLNYSDIKKNFFKHSISSIKNVKSLKKAIKTRYKKSLSHLSDNEKLSLGVAITELSIIKRF